MKCVSPGLVQPCRGSPPTTEFLDPLRFPPPFFLNAWIEFILSCYHRATNHSSPLTCKSSAYTSCLYSGDFQNFLCFTESQRSNPPPPQKNKNAVLSYQIWYHLPEVRTMTQTIIAYSTEYIMLLIVTETFVINIRGASAAQVSSTRQEFSPWYLWPVPSQKHSPFPPFPPCCISNKFPHHHCHVDAAKEGNMLNFQSTPKITAWLIVSQRKAIVCPWEVPQSQGLSADSLKRLTSPPPPIPNPQTHMY